MKKLIIQIDLDGTIVDFQSGIDDLTPYDKMVYEGRYDECPRIFSLMTPIDGAIEAVTKLLNDPRFDVYICSTAPWENPSAWSDKLEWVKKYLPDAYKRLTLTHHKELVIGDVLIDDRKANGADKFIGIHCQYGAKGFENWNMVMKFLNTYNGNTNAFLKPQTIGEE